MYEYFSVDSIQKYKKDFLDPNTTVAEEAQSIPRFHINMSHVKYMDDVQSVPFDASRLKTILVWNNVSCVIIYCTFIFLNDLFFGNSNLV